MKQSALPSSFVVAVSLSLLAACSGGGDKEKEGAGAIAGKVRFLGSAATGILVDQLGDAFVKEHPGVKIEVDSSNSNWGVGAAKEGTTDLGMSIRDLTPEEQQTLKEVVIGRDGLAIVVHKDNPVSAISDDQFKAILGGTITSWKELGGQDAKIERVNHAEVRTTLQLLIKYLGISQGPPDIRYSDSVASHDLDVIKSVSSVPEAVSYVSIGAALNAIAKGTKIKLIGFKGVEPTPANVENGTVPITFDMKLVARGTPEGAKKAFMDFASSPDRAELVKKANFAPRKG